MSESFLRLIPTDPAYIPTRQSRIAAQQVIQAWLPQAAEIKAQVAAQVNFVDSGTNLQRILCSHCGQEIHRDWWHSAMDSAYKTEFIDLKITTPCCGTISSLNHLRYDWPAGFARFVLEARDPAHDLNAAQLQRLEDVLGCQLRKIWARY